MVVLVGPVPKAPADRTCEDRRQGWNQENRIERQRWSRRLDQEEHEPILSASVSRPTAWWRDPKGGAARLP